MNNNYSTYFAKNSSKVYLLYGNRLFFADFLNFNQWQEINLSSYLGPAENITAACLDQYDYFHFVTDDNNSTISVLRKIDDSNTPQILGFIPDSDNGKSLSISALAVDSHNNKWMTQGRWLMAFNENGVGTAENQSEQEIRLYPNPSKEKITLMLDDAITNSVIFDITGQEIHQTRNSHKTIDISFFKNGVYLLKTQTKDKVYFSKFIKE